MMFDNKHKQKGLFITLLLHSALLVLFIYFGLSYQDPPPEQGVEIVFGFDTQGQGDFKPIPKSNPSNATLQEESVAEPIDNEVNKAEDIVEKPVEEVVEDNEEQLLTQDTEDSPIVASDKKKKKLEKEKAVKEAIEKAENDKIEADRLKKEKLEQDRLNKIKAEQDRVKKEKADKKNKLDGMFSNFSNTEDATGTDANQGDDNKPGYKGSTDGSKDAKSFTGNGGVGSYGDYQLGNRKPKSKPKPIYDGNGSGIVVVKIIVDKNGKVVFASAGVQGSTTTDLQLLKRAKEAALKTVWQSDENAPEKQEGKIIYNFIIEK